MINLNNRRLLILGAGRGQIGLYKAAKELGVATVAATLPDNNPPCLPLADEVCFVNILNPDEVSAKTSDIQFDGVATCCLDKGLKALGRLCDQRNFIGFSESVADLCNNKLLMKQRFLEHDVKTAPFRKISNVSELEDTINSLGGYPVMIKATDLAGSRGIYRATNIEEARSGFFNAIDATQKDFIIVERCLVGREFGAQAFIQNGRVLFVLPHGDILFHAATDVPVGHYVPFDIPKSLQSSIEEESRKAIKAVGLDNCAVNIDFIEENGEVYVLELSGRIGANGLPEVVSGYYDIDYYKMVVLAALDVPVDEIWNHRKTGTAVMSQMVYSQDKSGILKTITYNNEMPDDIIDLEFFIRPGSLVHKFENTTHCLGQFVVKAKRVTDCYKRAEEIMSEIKIELETIN